MTIHWYSLEWVIITFLLSGSFARASEESPLPETIVMPLQTMGIDPAERTAAASILEESMKEFRRILVPKGIELSKAIAKMKLTDVNPSNARDDIWIETGDQPTQKSTVWQSTWCRSIAGDVLFVEATHLRTGELLGSTHRAFKHDDIPQKVPEQFQQALSESISEVRQQINQTSTRTFPSVLKLGLKVQKETTRIDQGSSLCLSKLAESALLNSQPILNLYAQENLLHIQRFFNILAPQKRNNRILYIDWQQVAAKSSPDSIQVPISFRLSESVFGQSIQPIEKSLVTLALTDQRIKMTFEKNFSERIKEQETSLLRADLPQIAKVYGAWVYLDRGRAFGLKINDRLVVRGTTAPIEGHVIGFYGPELRIQSPRGYAIAEGAIVFIRKGQSQTKIAQELELDRKSYPTPWPPK